jgi:hypothetical protein
MAVGPSICAAPRLLGAAHRQRSASAFSRVYRILHIISF